MRYLCVHCDYSFEQDPDEGKKPRCPECLRVNGVEELRAEKSKERAEGPPRNVWAFAAAAAALVLAAVAFAFWSPGGGSVAVEDEVPTRPLSAEELAAYLADAEVRAPEVEDLFTAGDSVRAFAAAAADADGPRAQAEALVAAFRTERSEGSIERWSLWVPRETPVGSAEDVAGWLAGEDGHRLYPFEAAVLMTAALRSLGGAAMLAEVYAFPSERRPPDPTGRFGYYVVALYPEGAGRGEPLYFDPYEGRETTPTDVEVLTDLEALAGGLGLHGLHLFSHEQQIERALDATDRATTLRPRSATARAQRGTVLLTSDPLAGLREMRAALELKDDPSRQHMVAGVLLSMTQEGPGRLTEAERLVGQALEETPDFAAARATLAAIQLEQQDLTGVRASLRAVEEADPDLPILSRLWASYYAAVGDLDEAERYARRGVEENPRDVATRFLAARIFYENGDYASMRRQARAIVELAPPSQRDRFRQLMRSQFGSTALEDPDLDEEVELGDADAAPGEGGLSLESSLLGTGGGSGGPSLLGGDEGPSLLGDDTELPPLGGGGDLGGGGLRLGTGGGGAYGVRLGGGGE